MRSGVLRNEQKTSFLPGSYLAAVACAVVSERDGSKVNSVVVMV